MFIPVSDLIGVTLIGEEISVAIEGSEGQSNRRGKEHHQDLH